MLRKCIEAFALCADRLLDWVGHQIPDDIADAWLDSIRADIQATWLAAVLAARDVDNPPVEESKLDDIQRRMRDLAAMLHRHSGPAWGNCGYDVKVAILRKKVAELRDAVTRAHSATAQS